MTYNSSEFDISNTTTSQHSDAPLIPEDESEFYRCYSIISNQYNLYLSTLLNTGPSHYTMSMNDDDNHGNDHDDTYRNRMDASVYVDTTPSATVLSATINLANTILGAGMLAMVSNLHYTMLFILTMLLLMLLAISYCCYWSSIWQCTHPV
jgi:hypothetical protein